MNFFFSRRALALEVVSFFYVLIQIMSVSKIFEDFEFVEFVTEDS